MDRFLDSTTSKTVSNTVSPALKKRDIRHMKVSEDTYADVDLEEIKKQLGQAFYKDLSIGLEHGT